VISLVRVKGAKTVGFFREIGQNDLYFEGVRRGTFEGAADNKLRVVADLTVQYTFNLSDYSIDNSFFSYCRMNNNIINEYN
jgi:hypothetical protein